MIATFCAVRKTTLHLGMLCMLLPAGSGSHRYFHHHAGNNHISSECLVQQEAAVSCYLVPRGARCLDQFIFEEHLKPPCHTHWHSPVSEPLKKWVSVGSNLTQSDWVSVCSQQ